MQVNGFKVQIQKEVWDKIFMYARCCPQEISGLGKIEAIHNGVKIKEVFLVDQEVDPTNTNMNAKAVYEAVMVCAQKGQDTSDWGLWWHSHVNMNTFFSPTDQGTIEQLSSETPLVSICVNKAGKYTCRVDFYQPYRLVMTDVEVEVVSNPDLTLEEFCKADIKTHVKTTTFKGFMSIAGNKGNSSSVNRPFYGANGCVITPGDAQLYLPYTDTSPYRAEDLVGEGTDEEGYLVDATSPRCIICGTPCKAEDHGYCDPCKVFNSLSGT